MRSRSALQLRAVALATAATLALGASACGSSDDDGSSGGGSDQEQARATVESLYAGIKDGDAEKVCDQLNDAAQKQIQEGGLSGSKSDSCAASFQKFLDKAEKAGGLNLTLKAKVTSVKVTGDKAVALVNFGNKASNGKIPLEKVDGEWKLAAAGAAPSK